MFSLRAGRLAKQGHIEEARIEGERARDWCWYSVGVGLAVYFAVFIALLFTIRGGVLRTVYFNGDVFWSAAAWQSLLKGFRINIEVFLWSEAIVLVWALIVAMVRLLPNRACAPIRFVATAYCDLFRAVPAVLVILIINFGFQRARLPVLEHFQPKQYAILALVLVYGAYVAEVYRAGIESIHASQTAAARSLGLSYGQTLRFVVVPQAVRRVIPPLLNDFIGLQKDTALDLLHRRAGGALARSFHQQLQGHLHRLHHGGPPLRAHHHPDDPLRRAAAAAGPGPHARRLSVAGVAGMAYLEVDGVWKRFGENEVLRGVDLDVDTHEVVCLIGASGSGKSTLLRCINALEDIDGGEIRLGGERVSGRGIDVNALRKDVGIVFQSFNLFPHMTVLRNVTLAPTKVLGRTPGMAEERAIQLLRRIGLEEKANEYPDRLSGGQQQRVAIVRALAMEPQLLLLDEITSALDPELVAEVLNIVRQLATEGMTMVIATHEMGFAREVATKVCFLHEGVVHEEGPPSQVFGQPQQERTQAFLRRITEAGRL